MTSNVREVLTNPKCTGHMVWNRHARKGAGRNRLNFVEDWVWSPAPVHETLVDLETFVRAQRMAERRQRSRGVLGANGHPQTRRVYRDCLTGFVCLKLFGDAGRQLLETHAGMAMWSPQSVPLCTVTTSGRTSNFAN